MPEHDFDRIQPASLDLPVASPPNASVPTAREARPGAGAPLLIGLLVALAAAVVFLLPRFVGDSPAPAPTGTPGATSAPVAAAAPSAPASRAAPDAQSPWEEAQRERERAAAKQALDALLPIQFELEERKVSKWAQTEFAAATELAKRGDEAYRTMRYPEAASLYQQAGAQLQALRDGIGERLAARLTAGDAAFEAGDAAAATAAYGEAAAIEPGNARAERGLARSARLDELRSLLAAGGEREAAGNSGGAAERYRAALSIDPDWEPARKALGALEQRLAAEQSAAKTSAGYAALAAGRPEEARRAFQEAIRAGAGSAAREGLQQADFQLAQGRIGALLSAASAAERAEDWPLAIRKYEAALAEDAALGPAQEGKQRASTRRALDEALARIAAEPQRLASEQGRKAADTLIASAAAITDPGPRLSAQLAEARKTLATMRTEVAVELRSDGKTEVVLLRVGSLGSFADKDLRLLPGSYVAVGRREGYRDVRVEFTVRPGQAPPPVTVQCGQKV